MPNRLNWRFCLSATTGFEKAIEQLDEYFAGKTTAFDPDLRFEGDDF